MSIIDRLNYAIALRELKSKQAVKRIYLGKHELKALLMSDCNLTVTPQRIEYLGAQVIAVYDDNHLNVI